MVLGRLKDDGQGEIESVKARVEEGSTAQVSLEEDMKSKDADIQTLKASFAVTQYLFGCHLHSSKKRLQTRCSGDDHHLPVSFCHACEQQVTAVNGSGSQPVILSQSVHHSL